MRVYMIGRDYQADGIDPGETAGRFAEWLSGWGNPVPDGVISTWLGRSADAGRLGAVAESMGDLAGLRAAVTRSWLRGQAGRGPAGRAER